MSYDFFHYLGERLGSPIGAKLTYLFLAYQVIVSVLVFLFDSGFPTMLVLVGWILFMLLLACQILSTRKREKHEEKEFRDAEMARLQRISRLKQRLEADPDHRTLCRDCVHHEASSDSCRLQATASELEFRFRQKEARSYCLHWSPRGEETGEGIRSDAFK